MDASYFHHYATMSAMTVLLKFQEYLLLSAILTNAIASIWNMLSTKKITTNNKIQNMKNKLQGVSILSFC